MNKPWATLLLAAGSSTRTGGDTPKQYCTLAGKAVLAHAYDSLKNAGCDAITLITQDSHATHLKAALGDRAEKIKIIQGGPDRQASVFNGLKALKDEAPAYVLIHDAARPFLHTGPIKALKQAVEAGAPSATLALKSVDTLYQSEAKQVVDRHYIYALQTPQAFDYNALLSAHTQAPHNVYTDDTSLMHSILNIPPTLIDGHADHFKITTPEDLARAEHLALSRLLNIRTGNGFDVHAFGPPPASGTIRLFGVDIPCEKSLVGHSDADVALHAVADAILGTIGAADIGIHFPPSNAALKGMDSADIVIHALRLLKDAGGVLTHVDLTLLAEMPRINVHRPAILARLSQLLNLPVNAIGLKATTTERLGFVGRGEGVAVQALATVRLP